MYIGTTDGLTEPHTQPTAAVIRPQASDDVVPVFVDRSHSYSKMVENGETDVDGTHRPTDTYVDLSCQTDSARVQHEHHMTCLPDITIEDICDSAEMIQFYTGLPNRETLYGLFDTLTEFGIEGDDSSVTGPKRKLRSVDEFLLVMMRLRLGLLVKDLAFRFKISDSSVSRIFGRWITFMNAALKSLVRLPKLKDMQSNVPKCFGAFADTRIVLDCTEIYIQTPSSLENQSQTYSNYKSHNTFKALVGINMTGATVFVPKLYGGSTSDVQLTRHSGLYDLLEPGDGVMADKGFVNIRSDLSKIGCKMCCPPMKSKAQFTKPEVESTRRIASARIHVERKMEQIKNFRILQGVMPLALNHIADEIFFVCAALTNLLPPLVK